MSSALKLSLDFDEVTKKQFDFFSQILFNYTGIHLNDSEKNYSLLNNRLRKVLRAHGIATFEDLMKAMAATPSPQLKEDFINSLTTNKTDFFREKEHFNRLGDLIKDHVKNKNQVYLWSSASSTGQEAYTIAMYLYETFKAENFDKFKILATDIDTEVLKVGAEGYYQESQMDGLTPAQVTQYFDTVANLYSVKDFIKNKVHFSQLNLFNHPYAINKKFDVIFCRNVLIYFKPEDRATVCRNLLSYLNVGGLLIIGLSEAGSVQMADVESLGNSTYRKIR